MPALPRDLALFCPLKATVRGDQIGNSWNRLTSVSPEKLQGTSFYSACDSAITAHAVAAAEIN